MGEIHKEAFAALEYGVMSQNGILVLTGNVGTGKTTLINALIDCLDSDVCVAKIAHSGIDLMGFLSLVGQSFSISERFDRVEDFIFHFTIFLERKFIDNIRVLLIVDEAHKLSAEILEQIRLLANIQLAGKNLISIYLVGQNELTKKLLSRECRALRQRVTIHHQIKPLSECETLQYCLHRLRVAGSEIEIFDRKAITEIYRFSRGCPRMINIICDWALIAGYVEGVRKITPEMIKECAHELRLPGEIKIKMKHELAGTFWSAFNYFSRLSFQSKISATICLVALALLWLLWHQGIFSTDSNLPMPDNSLAKPDVPASYETEYHDTRLTESNVPDRTGASGFAKAPPGKFETEASIKKTANRPISVQKSAVADRQDVEKSEPLPGFSNWSKAAYSIQVGAFLNKDNAVEMASILGKKGYSASIVQFNDEKGKVWYTVRIGEYASQRIAGKHARDFSSKLGLDSIVRPIDRF